MRRAVTGLGLVLLLTSCSDGTTDQEQDRQEAGIHQIARQAVELPGIACAQGVVSTQGLPSAPRGSLSMILRTETTDDAQRAELLTQIARMIWMSDLSVTSLQITDTASTINLGEVLDTAGAPVRRDDLETAFGPRPPVDLPLPELDDPGNPDC